MAPETPPKPTCQLVLDHSSNKAWLPAPAKYCCGPKQKKRDVIPQGMKEGWGQAMGVGRAGEKLSSNSCPMSAGIMIWNSAWEGDRLGPRLVRCHFFISTSVMWGRNGVDKKLFFFLNHDWATEIKAQNFNRDKDRAGLRLVQKGSHRER